MAFSEWAVRSAATAAGLLTGYIAGRLHARARERERDRERAMNALAGGAKRDWEKRADDAEAIAVEHSRKGNSYDATLALDLALRIRQAHKGDR